MIGVLHVHSACFAIACLGHLYGNMLVSILAGGIAQPKSNVGLHDDKNPRAPLAMHISSAGI